MASWFWSILFLVIVITLVFMVLNELVFEPLHQRHEAEKLKWQIEELDRQAALGMICKYSQDDYLANIQNPMYKGPLRDLHVYSTKTHVYFRKPSGTGCDLKPEHYYQPGDENYENFMYWRRKAAGVNPNPKPPTVIDRDIESSSTTQRGRLGIPAANGNRRLEYGAYLQTDHWKRTRINALRRAGQKCQVCGSTERLEVHHNSYAHLYDEPDEDLVVLCKKHHQMFHGV